MPQLTFNATEWPARLEMAITADPEGDPDYGEVEVKVLAFDGSLLCWHAATLKGIELDYRSTWCSRVLDAYLWSDVDAVGRAHRNLIQEARQYRKALYELPRDHR
jgi:hypothetical protein